MVPFFADSCLVLGIDFEEPGRGRNNILHYDGDLIRRCLKQNGALWRWLISARRHGRRVEVPGIYGLCHGRLVVVEPQLRLLCLAVSSENPLIAFIAFSSFDRFGSSTGKGTFMFMRGDLVLKHKALLKPIWPPNETITYLTTIVFIWMLLKV